jgi:hypothetical protein
MRTIILPSKSYNVLDKREAGFGQIGSRLGRGSVPSVVYPFGNCLFWKIENDYTSASHPKVLEERAAGMAAAGARLVGRG